MNTAEPNCLPEDTAPEPGTEAEIHAICDALPALIAQVDGEEKYCFNNRAYETWFGLKPRELLGRTMRQVLGDETYREVQSKIRAALTGTRQTFESKVRHKDGTQRSVSINYIPRFTSIGTVEGMYILITDVTEHQRAEDQVRSLNADLERRVLERTTQLESANRELEAFCYSVSHDLRAPLRAVRGFTEVLLEQHANQLDPRGLDFLRRISEASLQMDRLVDDLLRLSRVSRSEVQPQEVNLSRMAEDIISELKKAEPARSVKTSIQPGLKALADDRLIRLVLDNLLRNAWKFTSKNTSAAIEFGKVDGDEPAFFVRDNGVGFDMAYAGRLFGVFQRLHSTADFPGSGVGLAIVQRVVKRHGGRVWAEGDTNKGAIFYFTLPVAALS
jgi:PAS domain S-box-containing protein